MIDTRERKVQKSQTYKEREGKLAKFGVRVPEESDYPITFPFSIEQILDEDFYGL